MSTTTRRLFLVCAALVIAGLAIYVPAGLSVRGASPPPHHATVRAPAWPAWAHGGTPLVSAATTVQGEPPPALGSTASTSRFGAGTDAGATAAAAVGSLSPTWRRLTLIFANQQPAGAALRVPAPPPRAV